MSQAIQLEAVIDAIRSVSEAARNTLITPDTRLVEDLSLDSLDLVAVLVHIQDHFQVELNLDEVGSVQTVADITAELARVAPAQAA